MQKGSLPQRAMNSLERCSSEAWCPTVSTYSVLNAHARAYNLLVGLGVVGKGTIRGWADLTLVPAVAYGRGPANAYGARAHYHSLNPF